MPNIHIPRKLKDHLRSFNPLIDNEALDLLDKLLVLNPNKRITATEALEHRYFKEKPLASHRKDIPLIKLECHDTLLRN